MNTSIRTHPSLASLPLVPFSPDCLADLLCRATAAAVDEEDEEEEDEEEEEEEEEEENEEEVDEQQEEEEEEEEEKEKQRMKLDPYAQMTVERARELLDKVLCVYVCVCICTCVFICRQTLSRSRAHTR
jgi:flagellar biosynthesis component FlhA